MSDHPSRKLAVILHADVVGSTDLVQRDESLAHRRIQDCFGRFSKKIQAYGGVTLEIRGDALVAEFARASDAVIAAIAFQIENTSTNIQLQDDVAPQLRIGISLGEVIVADNTVTGAGVVLAQRLEQLATPGGVVVQGSVVETVPTRLPFGYETLGEQTLKGFHEPVRAFVVNLKSGEPVPDPEFNTAAPETGIGIESQGMVLELPDKPSIAVLPFINMSGDPEQAYFADGITEDIITALSRSPWLFIIARNTTFTYKGENVEVKRVAHELGVRYVLEGSVRKAGNRIRVAAQLIDGTSGGHVWSERYDGQLADVFDLQDEITRNVVASIQTQVHLTASEPARRSNRPDLTVWELTMRGWQLLYDFSPESFTTAKKLLNQALTHDPDSAEATLVLALIHYHNAIMGYVDDYHGTLTAARELALRATRLDNRNEYAHWALGITCWGLARHDESIVALERALELNPNCSLAYGSLGTALGLVGRVEESIANQEIAIRSNPRDPSIFFRFTGISLAHYLAGRYDTAVEWAGRAIHRMPKWYLGHFLLVASHVRANRLDEAKAAVDRCREALPDASVAQLDRIPLKDATEMERFRDCLQQAGLPGRANRSPPASFEGPE